MIFCKYEFEPAVWESLKQTIQEEVAPEKYTWNNCSVVEIGYICIQWGEDGQGKNTCLQYNPMYAVDILWYGDIPEDFNQYEVFPNPEGVHTFAGLEYLYTERFCQFNPDSPYCNVDSSNL